MSLPAQRLRDVLAARAIIVPGVFDALGARVASQAGFEALFLSGYGVSAARLPTCAPSVSRAAANAAGPSLQ